MTNHHVFGDAGAALDWLLELDYQDNSSGDLLPVHRYKIDPNYFFYSNPQLDFTLAGVAAVSDKQKPLSAYPWVKLIRVWFESCALVCCAFRLEALSVSFSYR
jgi:hypothetical protein